MAYDKLDPIGKGRDELGWAVICSVVTNLARSIFSKPGTRPELTSPNDFLPNWGGRIKEEPKMQSVDEMKNALLRIADLHNKTFQKRGPIMKRKGKKHG